MAVAAGGFVAAVGIEYRNGTATGNRPSASYFGLGVAIVVLPLCGGLIALRRPENGVGWLLVGGGALISCGLLAHAWAVRALIVDPGGAVPLGTAAAWLATWLFVPGYSLLVFAIGRFPDGRVAGRRAAVAERAAAAGIVALTLGQAFARDRLDGVRRGRIDNPLGIGSAEGVVRVVTAVAVAVLVIYVAVVVVDLVGRTRRTRSPSRERVRWLALPFIPLILSIVAAVAEHLGGLGGAVDPTIYVGQGLFLAGISFGVTQTVLRTDVFAAQRTVDRSLVYALLSGAVALAFLAVVTLVGLLSSASGVPVAVAAASVTALTLSPLRGATQRRVNRIVYGASADPVLVVQSLARSLDASARGEGPADAIVATVAGALGVAYVAVEVGAGRILAAMGEPPATVERLAMTSRGAFVGTLVIGADGTGRSAQHVRLLEQLVLHAGPAVESQVLAEEVERSRTQIVLGREDERQRIRRDLHDGIGPALAGMGLQLDALVTSAPSQDAKALLHLRQDLNGTVTEIRRIISGLRPPAIDDLGLVGALRARGEALGGELCIEFDIPDALPELSAAAEVAIYRIVSEALTNTAVHAAASFCRVGVAWDTVSLRVSITDDGRGIPDGCTPGVGLESMRARAVEIGGSLTVGSIQPRGTQVVATIPRRP